MEITYDGGSAMAFAGAIGAFGAVLALAVGDGRPPPTSSVQPTASAPGPSAAMDGLITGAGSFRWPQIETFLRAIGADHSDAAAVTAATARTNLSRATIVGWAAGSVGDCIQLVALTDQALIQTQGSTQNFCYDPASRSFPIAFAVARSGKVTEIELGRPGGSGVRRTLTLLGPDDAAAALLDGLRRWGWSHLEVNEAPADLGSGPSPSASNPAASLASDVDAAQRAGRVAESTEPPGVHPSPVEAMRDLAILHSEGLIDDAEFAQRRSAILDRISRA